ncbi:inositol monophosphatase family protein [Pseudonocardia acaciae]|uniref:inositol monophosphatase family protein n=1 Tax=Pseudonocardia acaciae TaxID=551276 RepID=UPI00048C600A|nr:inositol monophosphatase family protein [Pseudonocardia acaciae]
MSTMLTELLTEVTTAVQAAGALVRQRFTRDARPNSLEDVLAALRANDEASLSLLREPLRTARPAAGWIDDELETGALPDGEWWVADPVEGNINHVHGLTDWSVTATLVRDNRPVLTAVHLPLAGDTYTASAGGGAFLNGAPLRPSAKTRLDGAYVGTGQARPGDDPATLRRLTRSLSAMLDAALVTRSSVPATLQLIEVAAGRMDVFWQHSDVRSGLLAGALLVAEAGGTVTDTRGNPWTPASPDLLAAAPGLHRAAVDVLSAANGAGE